MTFEEGSVMCGQWGQEQILDHLQGRLPEAESDRFRVHAISCAECRTSVEELSSIVRLAGAAPVRPGRAAEESVLAVIRREAARRSKPAKPPTRRRLRRPTAAPTPASLAWVFAAAAVFMVALVSAIVSSSPAPRPPVVRATPPPSPIVEESPRPVPPPPPVVPSPPPTPPMAPPKPVLPPVEPPKEPPTPPPAPASKPKPPTVTETKPAAVEIAQVVKGSGRFAVGDRILAGDTIQCASGVLLLETSDKSQIALKAGTTLTAEAQGATLTLRMAEGEVACSVKTRPDRRFVVMSTHGTVTVKGTIFGVRATSLGTAVTVAKGRVEARTEVGVQEVGAGERSSMSRSTSPGRPESVNADRLLSWAYDAGLPSPGTMWLVAGSGDLQAPMARGRASGSISPEPIFAGVDSRTLAGWNGRSLAPNQKEGGWATLTVDIPETGTWYLWGRFFNPASGSQLWKADTDPKDNDPNSFFVSVDDGRELVFGNHKMDPEAKVSGYRRWHWGGDGKIEVGRPGALSLGTLAKGRHTIRIRNRDAVETPALRLAPRLDVLCLTPDREYRPRDEDFRK
jgi:hypothetical protein